MSKPNPKSNSKPQKPQKVWKPIKITITDQETGKPVEIITKYWNEVDEDCFCPSEKECICYDQ